VDAGLSGGESVAFAESVYVAIAVAESFTVAVSHAVAES